MKNRYYFISKTRLKEKCLYPRIPKNRLTESGREDNVTPRICVSKSILGCFYATEIFYERKLVYLYYTDADTEDVVQPTEKQVSDAKFTGEEWIVVPAKFQLESILHISRIQIADEFYEYKIQDKDSIGFYRFSIFTHK